MKNNRIIRGFVAVLSFTFVTAIIATITANNYKNAVNSVLVKDSTTSVTDEDSIYFKSDFGDFTEENEAKLIQATVDQTVKEMEEGAVLLKNNAAALPLSNTEKSITIFGASSVNPVIKCASSGNTAKGSTLLSMGEAFKEAGFSINEKLWDAYGGEKKDATQDLTREISEKPASFYTSELKNSWKDNYNDVAIIFLSREQGEGHDFSMKDSEGKSQLALHDNEREMIEMVTSDTSFKKVIAVLNIPTSMEVGWLDQYGIDACLWIGAPGQSGFRGMVNILSGKANPSGRLVDAYPTNSLSAPAVVNSGTNTGVWSNLSEMSPLITSTTNTGHYRNVTVQSEGIYVGYKYYETRYEDLVLNRGNAGSSAGSSDGLNWDYSKEMSYTFGYGLSYASFDESLVAVTPNDDNTYTIDVKVKNTSSQYSGKRAVQVYAQTPYGEYEKTNKVEKSAIQIVGFEKTGELAPGEEEIVHINVDKYLLASYDYKKEKGYILSEGDYYFAIGEDSHEALNNVLAKKGKTVSDGMTSAGDPTKAYTWHMSFDKDTYDKSAATGYEVTNQFDDCDFNFWSPNTYEYLTRDNWKDTYPRKLSNLVAPSGLITVINGKTYEKPSNAPDASSFKQSQKNGLVILDMMGKEYDDPTWESYLDEMSLDELAGQLIEGFSNEGVASVGKPSVGSGDGMDSINHAYKYGKKTKTSNYTSTVTLACTWNKDLYLSRGNLMGEEGLWCRNLKNHSVGGDLHRTQFGGRNFEYISEDGNMCGFVGSILVEGMNKHGVHAAMKHMAGNDQEYGRTGLCTFFNEQAYRETALRMYEMAVTQSSLSALMTGLNRLGGTYCTQSEAMLTNVLRKEWGFVGSTISDADSATYGNVAECLTAGLDVFCCDFSEVSRTRVTKIIKNGDGYVYQKLRDAIKNTHYLVANGCSMNGLTKNTVIDTGMKWWQKTLIGVDSVIGLAYIAIVALYVVTKHDLIKKEA